jgi:hypothetical protein
MALLVTLAPVVILAVLAGLLFAVEIERAQSKPIRRGTVPPHLRRRTISGIIEPRF